MLARLLSLPVGVALLTSAIAAERPLAIDVDHSRIDIGVHASFDSFSGGLKSYEPVVMIDDTGRVIAARVTFHFRDVLTGKEKRDQAMHKWQQTDTFPDGVFVLTALESAAADTKGMTAVGKLTFHGLTRDLRFPISVMRAGALYVIDGDATVDVREFGLPIIRMLAVLKVDPLVHVRFHLQGRSET